MSRAIRILTTVGLIVMTLYVLRWFDTLHLTVAVLLALVLDFLASRIIARPQPRRRGSPSHPDGASPHVFGHAWRGTCLALSALVLLALFHVASLAVPAVKAAYLDRDRSRLERTADRLESEAKWLAAAELLASRSQRHASPAWSSALHHRVCLNLSQAAAVAPNESTALSYLKRTDVPSVPSDNASPIVDAIRRLWDLRRELEQSRVREMSLAQEVSTLGQDQTELSDRIGRVAKAHLATLLYCGELPELNAPIRKRFYEEAIVLARTYSLEEDQATEGLQRVEAEIADSAAIVLPDGVEATIVAVHAGPDPRVLAIDFTLQDASGHHLPGLQPKDVKVTAGSMDAQVLGLCKSSMPSRTLSVALLLDTSDSTQGQPLEAAQLGAKRLLAKLPNGTSVKLLAFSSTVATLSDWSPNMSELAPRIDKVQSGGQTALLSALTLAAQELQSRDGPKAIVVFTDGRDTVGGRSLNEIIADCQASQVTLSAIGLATAELDVRSLQQAAAATGGSFLSADNVEDLARRFEELATRLQEPVYRVTALAKAENLVPITVAIGRDNQIYLQSAPLETIRSPHHTVARRAYRTSRQPNENPRWQAISPVNNL